MMPHAQPAKGTLWAQVEEDGVRGLPLWKALLVAITLEIVAPILLLAVDWSFLRLPEPPVTPVINVRLDPAPEVTPPPEPPRKIQPEKKIKQVEVEMPPPLPAAVRPKINVPKPEPRVKPKRKLKAEAPLPKPEPKPAEQPEPEPEAPALPSVFQDVKPVRKVKPKYPPEAEAQHIEGRVRVRLSVNIDGDVTGTEVLVSEPPGVFDEAVLEAVRQYKFKRDGTSYKADQEIVFKID
ncbi:MAG TPA: TonB family protein [Burkholderiales bacterium]|nr:TonB family protein [Burkholderiales bacterium]